VNPALENGRTVAIACVGESDAPRLSFRGSTQACGDAQLAICACNPEGESWRPRARIRP
jgi:hypothetical protein